jgi:formylglycine-generating enzyme required for sulfatase activity
MGWYKSNAGEKTHPVGTKQPNAWGLYDMHGNVWEWCLDVYDPGFYGKSTGVDPVNTDSGSLPVIRGGCWDDGASNCRSADRDWYNPCVTFDILGFRVCLVRK